MASNAALAQQAADEEKPAVTSSEGEIVVTGIRESLANAQKIKRDSDTVVDAITSEDIGALPDRSVTEALQRLPGVSISRFSGSNDPDHFSVEGSGVVIRGLNFVRSEFNGRTAFAAGVGGQALNFSDVPSELLGSVIVSKNATADMVEGGLAGTVNLNTRKPFDNKGFRLAFSAEANYGDFRKEWTPTFSGLISKTWDTDKGTFGLLVSGSYSRIKSRADGLQITNFQTRDNRLVNRAFSNGAQVCRNPLPGSGDTLTLPAPNSPCGTALTTGADGFVDPAAVRYAPLGGQFRRQDFDRKRNGQTIAAQFESIDQKTLITAEFIRSHSSSAWSERTFETAPDTAEYGTFPIGCQQNSNGPYVRVPDSRGNFSNGDPTTRGQCVAGQYTDYVYDSNNLFQSGYITNPNNGWRGNNAFVPIGGLQQTLGNRGVEESTTNKDFGLNLKTELTDRLHLNLDAQYATSRKKNLDVSVFGSTFADQELDLTGDLPSVTPHKPNFLSYSWGGDQTTGGLPAATDAQYFADPRFTFWRAAMDHIEDSEGTQYAFKGDLSYDFGEDSFFKSAKIGANYQDREQIVRYSTYNWGVLSEVWGGSRPVNFADTPGQVELYSAPNFFRGQVNGPPTANYYNGNLTKDYTGSSAFFRTVVDRWNALGAGQAGWQPLANRGGTNGAFLPTEIQPVTQQDFAAYGMLNFGTDNFAGDTRLSGNIGLRYVNTNVTSAGSLGVGSAASLGISGTFASRCATITLPNGQTSTPGGICDEGPAAYLQLQQFANGSSQYNVARGDYNYLLPSLNLKLGLSDDIVLRFAGSKVLARADNAVLRNFMNVSLDGSGALTAEVGNPAIRPATAWQFDATAEWYFARVGSITFNAFYKDISDFFYQNVRTIQFTSNNITRDILVRGPDNFDGKGKVKGFEIAYQQTYDFLPGFLSGLGFSGNYTYIKSKGLPNSFLNGGVNSPGSTVPTGNLPLEQLSKHNINAALFYEKGPVSLRAAYNWRSRFLLTAADVIFPFYSIFNEPTGQLDASAFINLTDNIKIGVQGVNLLNEVTRTSQAYTGDPSQLAPRSYFMNDRRFSFVLRGNF
ncbi:TonB-dependent receptor [Sphingorhabdus lutea]|uniref:TonB-dependent receptor n=1 Tax=Sphingorhabdus lutea TaxID=1913578 RepID=A0A1L3JES8_9SPHN|nr:TonB-dependent receptor [Sphingorhabdus lutea]